MEEKKKINFKELAKNTIEFSNEKYKEAKNFTTKTAMPKLKETLITKMVATMTTMNISGALMLLCRLGLMKSPRLSAGGCVER